ncbi:MAG: hypothetical protein HKM93_05950 [Desulfobacteraceae bacterium]|nr:hypothetical protein [Desulfobacteraceae bacterium]
MRCQICGYHRRPGYDDFIPQYECPQCGVIYAKTQPREADNTDRDIPVNTVATLQKSPGNHTPPSPKTAAPVRPPKNLPGKPAAGSQARKHQQDIQTSLSDGPRLKIPEPSVFLSAQNSNIAKPNETETMKKPDCSTPLAKKSMEIAARTIRTPQKTLNPRIQAAARIGPSLRRRPAEPTEKKGFFSRRKEKRLKLRRLKMAIKQKKAVVLRKKSFNRRYAGTSSLEETLSRKHGPPHSALPASSMDSDTTRSPANKRRIEDYAIRVLASAAWGMLILGGLGSIFFWVASAVAHRLPPAIIAPANLPTALGVFLGFASLLTGVFCFSFCLFTGYLTRTLMDMRKTIDHWTKKAADESIRTRDPHDGPKIHGSAAA